jgi:hypothetical protein
MTKSAPETDLETPSTDRRIVVTRLLLKHITAGATGSPPPRPSAGWVAYTDD